MQIIPLTLQCSKVASNWADKFQECIPAFSGKKENSLAKPQTSTYGRGHG